MEKTILSGVGYTNKVDKIGEALSNTDFSKASELDASKFVKAKDITEALKELIHLI